MWKFSRLAKQGRSNKLLNKNKSIPKYFKSHLFDGRQTGEILDVGDMMGRMMRINWLWIRRLYKLLRGGVVCKQGQSRKLKV